MGYQPLNTTSSQGANYNQINDMIRQLDKEQITKAFKQAGGNSVITGKLPDGSYGTQFYDANNKLIAQEGQLPYPGGYGSIYYDANGIPIVIIGILPDLTVGIAVSKTGISVIDAFS